jgi:serine protease Do
MNVRALGSTAAVAAIMGMLFFSGFTLGKAQAAGRPVIRQIDKEALQEILQSVDAPSRPFVAATNAARPGVVHILTTRLVPVRDPFEDFWDMFPSRRRRRLAPQQTTGSGAVVDPRGYILTNFDDIKVQLGDGRVLAGKAIALERETDLALIKVEGGDTLPAITLGDSDKLEVGQWVLAIGNPFGLERTVTSGIISATGRTGVGVADVEDFIQTDTPINPGNSGGPLIDLQGRIVGITTAIFSRSGGYQGIGFAIPINFARDRMLKKYVK